MADFVDPLGALSSAPATAVGGAGAVAPPETAHAKATSSASSAMSSVTVVLPSTAAFDPLSGGGGSTRASGGAGASSSSASAPLTMPTHVAYGSSSSGGGGATSTGKKHSPYLDWSMRKAAVLKEFTVTGKIAVSASFMSDAADDTAGEETSLPLAKARQRLEQLEAAARGVATVEMSQTEYVRRIERLHRALSNAWESNHRVAALKICIQCAKLLGEHRVPQFYPSMFVMVTDILDTFGRLVFERLKALADEEYRRIQGSKSLSVVLPEDFIAADVGGEARETCRNWMYKTACIRELLPRIYVEMALLECYRFIYDADFASILMRLAHSIRGIGNPVVAAYARLYLARMAAKLVRDDNRQRESMLVCITDFMSTYADQIIAPGARSTSLEALGISMPVYLQLFQPALAWQMHQLAWGASNDVYSRVLQVYAEKCGNSLVLHVILEAFDPFFFANDVPGLIALINDAKPSLSMPADIYRTLAIQFTKHPPPPEQRLLFLNEAYNAAKKVADPVLYAKNASALMGLIAVAYSEREMLLLLGDLVKRMRACATSVGTASAATASAATATGGAPARTPASRGKSGAMTAPAATLPHLENILKTIVEAEVKRASAAVVATGGAFAGRFSGALTSDHFTSLLDLFDAEHKPRLCKSLLTSLSGVQGSITDPVVVNTMLEVARTCHDSLDVLSSEDEQRTVATLICNFVSKIDLGRDLERQLELYVDCRQAFPNLDAVKHKLVTSAIDLTWRALKFVKGRHTAKTLTFVKSVLAYVAITIPDMDDPFERMRLYQSAGIAALHNNCVAQGDMLLRGVVQEIPELPASLAVAASLSSSVATATAASAGGAAGSSTSTATDLKLIDGMKEFTAAVVPAPGHPEHGPFYLARGLFNALQKYPWQPQSVSKLRAMALLIPLLHAQSLEELPVHIPGLDSNDVLYAGDVAYKEELQGFVKSVLEGLIGGIGELQTAVTEGDVRAKGLLMEILPELLSHTDIVLDVSLALAPAIESICLALKALAAEHPALKATIQRVRARLTGGTAASS